MLNDIRFLWRDQPTASRWGALTVAIWLLAMARVVYFFVDGQTLYASIFGGVLVLMALPFCFIASAALSVARSRWLGGTGSKEVSSDQRYQSH